MSRTPLRSLLLTVLVLGACKGETVIQPDPQTKTELEACQKDKAAKDSLIKTLQDENANLMREKGQGGEVVVTIDGTLITIKSNTKGGGAPGPALDPKVVEAASKEFYNLVEKSRGAIQKCYEQALKKDTAIQARTISLRVFATFSNTGQYKSSSFEPVISATFDECMKAISSKWQMPQNSPAMTFRAQVSLTPS